MADGFSVTFHTEEASALLADKQEAVRKATMWALRETGRRARDAGRAKAPVWKGRPGSPTVGAVHRGAAFRAAGGIGPIQGGGGGPVPGLLRASIAPTKTLREIPGGWSLKVGPRGARVHLYAGKEEVREHYMATAAAMAEAVVDAITSEAFWKVWKV